ncbi:hypothetical protein KKF32_03175 [Patescibacteria group bacterium]|nr:hypothetical protein [Patescibacteria group bacterium]
MSRQKHVRRLVNQHVFIQERGGGQVQVKILQIVKEGELRIEFANGQTDRVRKDQLVCHHSGEIHVLEKHGKLTKSTWSSW